MRPRQGAPFCKIIGKFTLSDRVKELEAKAGVAQSRLIRTPKDLIYSLTHENWQAKTALFDLPSNSGSGALAVGR